MKVLKGFLLMTIFVTVFYFNSAFAAVTIEAPSTSGSGDWSNVCDGTSYCYNSMGLRFTLYKYVDSTTAQKVGYSHDFWRYDRQCANRSLTTCNESTMERPPFDYGYKDGRKVSEQRFSDPKYSDVINNKKNGVRPNSSKFSLTSTQYKNQNGYYTLVDNSIWSYDPVSKGDSVNTLFRAWLRSPATNKLIQYFDSYSEIQDIYHLTTAQLNDIRNNPNSYFLTAEMLGSISTNNASNRPSGFATNKNYLGTVFELNQFYAYTGIFTRYAKALYLSTPVSMNGKTIVGNTSNNILRTIGGTINQANIWSNRAIGMTVFKLTDIIRTCRTACSEKRGDSLLICAEAYCESDPANTSSSQKKTCITACGYRDPGESTCGSDTCDDTNSNDNDCQTTNKITSKTCKDSTYYKTECTEELTLNYSSGLPKVFINSLGGFNYFVDTSGKKTCTLTFNKDKYEFEYAALKRSERNSRSAPVKALNDFQNLVSSETNDSYKFTWDDNDTIKMTVNDNDTKELYKSKDDSTDPIRKNYEKGVIHNYGDSTVNITNKFTKVVYSSDNTSSWELPQMCYHLKDNSQEVIWNSTSNDLACNNDGKAETFYYGYYIKKVTDADGKLKTEVPVDVKVTKKSLNNDNCISKNKCYYLNETEDKTAECNMSFEKTGNGTYKVKYNVINRSSLSVSCKFNGEPTNCNIEDSAIITLNSNETKKVDGSVTYTTTSGESVTVSCPVIIKNEATSEGETCKNLYKPAEYAGIKKYCRENWNTDTAGYGSYDSCVSDCSKQDGKELCENKFKPNQTTQIKEWCKNNFGNSGYKSKESCINTCTTTKIGEGYTYRPIALGSSDDSIFKFNAFPKRKAGTNWYGYEQKYTVDDNDYNEDPIYVINLSADNIKAIKKNTKESGKNVYGDFIGRYETDGSFFRSQYIDNNLGFFTRVNKDYWKGAD